MYSRRTSTPTPTPTPPPRSSRGNGRSHNGNDVGGSGRPSSCSYLSNVRPENRSTLCSVMAQLTEETQPSFQTTLKSKAVSENSYVKFTFAVTGYPIPQVTWYKDDVQLDRYCGLPKYEIFRNAQNHSLHIYNCTVEDAAIYQASASNSKGIVSCSGVLEVGEMNEFKIHQRYFGKLKQKAEIRRGETEGKENQEPLRTISPDRAQRKRRSTMDAFLSPPSSVEDEGIEESVRTVAVGTEARLQEAPAEEVEEKPIPVTKGAATTLTNGQTGGDSAYKTSIHDSAQKISTAHEPKTPFVKKKIKMSNSTAGERPSEERRAHNETVTSLGLGCTEPVESEGNLEEFMEVENTDSSDSRSKNGTERHKKSETEEVLRVERPSKGVEVAAPSQKGPPLASTSHNVSRTEVKRDAKHEKKAGRKDAEQNSEARKPSPHMTSTPPPSRPARSPSKDDLSKAEHVEVMLVDEKSNTLAHRDFESVNAPREGGTSLLQRPCERTGGRPPARKASPAREDVPGSRPARLNEVTPAHTKRNRNDAPVSLEPPPNQTDAQPPTPPPRKAKSERETTADDVQTPSLRCGLQAKMTQDTWDHSRGSDESRGVLFTDVQKSPLQRPGGGGENSPGCNVSSSTKRSQINRAIKTVDGTEIQVNEKVEGTLLAESNSAAPNEKIVEMETESGALSMIGHVKIEKTKDAASKDANVVIVEGSHKETEKNERIVDMETNSASQALQSSMLESANVTKTSENTNLSELQIKDFQEIPKPVTEVISVAGHLRSQIKTLESRTVNVVAAIPVHLTTVTGTCEESKEDDRKPRAKKSTSDREADASITLPGSIKEPLVEVYNQQNETDRELLSSHGATSPPVLPAVSGLDSAETEGLQGSDQKHRKGVMDIGRETTEASSQFPPKDRPLLSLSGRENVKRNLPPLTSRDELTEILSSRTVPREPGTPIAVTNTTVHATEGEPVQGKHMGVTQKLTPESKLNFQTDVGITVMNSTPVDQCDMEEHAANGGSSRTDFLGKPTPEASPLLKKRDCVSPIPSATPRELASGARRKILAPKAKSEETSEASKATSPVDSQTHIKDVPTESGRLSVSPAAVATSPSSSRRSALLQPPVEQTSSPAEKRSPLLNRRKAASETQAPSQTPTEEIHSPKPEGKPAEKDKHDPFKAPQVIRKIRAETFADASGHLKLWCQFFNVLSDSTIAWHRNTEAIAHIQRNAGDETQVNLAIVQATSKDSGVYGCTITNDYGTDSTDCLLSAEILAGMSLREDLGVGEEIEMTPLIFNKGVADTGVWGNAFFGRIMMQESHIGDGCARKVWRAKVIYGLEPVFESGNTCIVKECKIRNLAREYCKIFSAEARAIEAFGLSLEVIPVYLMYRPANTVPYATVEADLPGNYQKYSVLDESGGLATRSGSEAEQKCCALQHWIFQWTNGGLLLSRLEGVDTKITNVGISVKSTGHHGLSVEGTPKVLEQFVSQHQCNYFCGLLSLRSLKVMDSLSTPSKPKGSRSPLLQRKMAAADSSSPQAGRRAAGSPRPPRKTEREGGNTH
ncbi:Alpha-protein kinase 3 [Liparis tanakae]|uniref:non-specific serine/threonine protein kinase n=1 Tax=Liparis tanakae TaxID=230148 RepID=A0A4Z2GPR0_9TELE|nr:Alpha-protein kinase 3 [Liparis tanakae]